MNIDQLIKLVYRKDYDALKRAIVQGSDVNATDEDGRTPLMHAVLASDADPKMVRFLIQNGADPNASDKDQKWTVLHFAARDQKLPIVLALLESGSVVDAEDSFGNTPLWRTVLEGKVRPELVQLLVKHGANPDKKNHHGVSPKDIAQKTGKTEILAILEK